MKLTLTFEVEVDMNEIQRYVDENNLFVDDKDEVGAKDVLIGEAIGAWEYERLITEWSVE